MVDARPDRSEAAMVAARFDLLRAASSATGITVACGTGGKAAGAGILAGFEPPNIELTMPLMLSPRCLVTQYDLGHPLEFAVNVALKPLAAMARHFRAVAP